MWFDDSKSLTEKQVYDILKKVTSIKSEDRLALFQDIEAKIKNNPPTEAAKKITEMLINILDSVKDQAAEGLFEPQEKLSPIFRRV